MLSKTLSLSGKSLKTHEHLEILERLTSLESVVPTTRFAYG